MMLMFCGVQHTTILYTTEAVQQNMSMVVVVVVVVVVEGSHNSLYLLI